MYSPHAKTAITFSFSPALTTYVPTTYAFSNSRVTMRPLPAEEPGRVVDTDSGSILDKMAVPAMRASELNGARKSHSKHLPYDFFSEIDQYLYG
jgi:hypothetical protein